MCKFSKVKQICWWYGLRLYYEELSDIKAKYQSETLASSFNNNWKLNWLLWLNSLSVPVVNLFQALEVLLVYRHFDISEFPEAQTDLSLSILLRVV